MSGLVRPGIRGAVVAFALAAVLQMSACSFTTDTTEPSGTASPDASTSPNPSASPSSSPSPTPSPTPSPEEPTGPITGAPSDTPVTPEIFMATVDTGEGVLRVVVLVPGIYEDGGDCAVTVKGKASTLLREGEGAADVSSTACGQFTFSLSQLGSGKASITASYKSDKYSGTSKVTEVSIP